MGSEQDFLVIHNENRYASGRLKRPRGPRSTLTASLGRALDVTGQDLCSQAIFLYLKSHLQPLKSLPDIVKGMHHGLGPLLLMYRQKFPILDLAISSMALAVYSRTKQHPLAAYEASKKYHQLLQIVQKTISSIEDTNIDAYLLAIFFMGRYEDTIYSSDNTPPKVRIVETIRSFSHHDGALAILKFWKDRLSQNMPATDIIKHSRRGLLRSALLRNRQIPEWMQDGALFGEQGLELNYSNISVRICNLRGHLSELIEGSARLPDMAPANELVMTIKALDEEVRNIDIALEDWKAHFPNTWCCCEHTLPDIIDSFPTDDFYSSTVYTYSNPAYAAVWNLYYAMSLLINCTRLKILNLNDGAQLNNDFMPDELLQPILSRITNTAHKLASTIPFCLQKVKVAGRSKEITVDVKAEYEPYVASLMVIWPLSIATSLRDLKTNEKAWLRCQLSRVGRMIGSGIFDNIETGSLIDL
jgi:hypothetical protein